MGAWGDTLFENDDALDCAGDVIEYLEKQIEKWFKYGKSKLDECEYALEGNIGPLLFILTKVSITTGACPPNVEKVRKWKARFMEAYDEHCGEGWDEKSTARRRKMFLKLFSVLENHSKKYGMPNDE